MLVIDKVVKIDAGTAAVTVDVGFQAVALANAGSATVYFRFVGADGEACTKDNGYPLLSGQQLPYPLRAKELSFISESTAQDVRVMFLIEE